MILSYTRADFEQKILSGEKTTTFRKDKSKRWKIGMKIQHWMGFPRAKKEGTHFFMEDEVFEVEDVELHISIGGMLLIRITTPKTDGQVCALPKSAWRGVTLEIAKRDGFNTIQEMADYFCPNGEKWEGRMIVFSKFSKQR